MRSSLSSLWTSSPAPTTPGYCAGICYRLVRAGFSALFATTLLFAAGCPSPQTGSTGRGSLSIPAEGQVRVVASQIENTPTRRHFKWSVIGERNWVEAKADEGLLSLGTTYPLNSATRHDGTNIYEADVTAQIEGDALVWESRLHGINGAETTNRGREPLGGRSLDDAFQVRQKDTAVTGLPADLLLARVGERDVRLTIAK